MVLIVNYEVREEVLLTMSAAGSAARTFADGATTTASPVVTTAALGLFTQADVGKGISGAGIPAGAVIDSVQSSTSLTLDRPATATGTGVSLTIAAESAGPFAPAALTFRLYTQQLPPGDRVARADVLAAEATFPGYAPLTIPGWGEVYKDGGDNVYRNGPLLQWTAHGTVSPSQTVYGVAWDDGQNVSIDPLATPVNFALDDDALSYVPIIAYGG